MCVYKICCVSPNSCMFDLFLYVGCLCFGKEKKPGIMFRCGIFNRQIR